MFGRDTSYWYSGPRGNIDDTSTWREVEETTLLLICLIQNNVYTYYVGLLST